VSGVLRALGVLERVDGLGGAAEDVGHGPALQAGIGVDLRAMVHLVLAVKTGTADARFPRPQRLAPAILSDNSLSC